MKKIKFMLMIVLALQFSSCERQCKPINRPKDVKPIDWENYNDVYTVYWNLKRNSNDPRSSAENKKIKIFGWMPYGYRYDSMLYLTDNPAFTTQHYVEGKRPTTIVINGVPKEQTTKKCSL